ncbi:MAG: family 78 glycoside hydrolase catalytic domain [Mangrovibacterium sp.]|nr:family 78 glycoside hydrolase catalytic domain [Mangrovibacterium sp.]
MNQQFRSFIKLFAVIFFFKVFTVTAAEKNSPSGLAVNFLSHAGQVFLNGYPANTLLEDAAERSEHFQFAEIAHKKPFFGWIVGSAQPNTLQTAYRILVASSLGNMKADKGDCWDSGKVESDESVNVLYAGEVLKPGQVYFWKVKTWDNHGAESDFSAVSRFKTAAEMFDYTTARYPLQKQDEFPVAIRSLSGSATFVDFGKDAFGRLRVRLNGKAGGDTVTIHLGEALKDGRIDAAPGGTVRYCSYRLVLKAGWNTYVIAIKPDKRNTGPRAIKMPGYIGEVTPFRYCELEGYKEITAVQDIIRETVFYPFDETESSFTSSDTVLNQVWELCKYSIKATSFMGIYVDGDRERIPYEADAYINQLGHYGVAREYSMARYSHEYLVHHATWPTEWILQSVLMAWNDYLYTGNKESLLAFYQDLQAKTLTALADEAGFISTRSGKVTPEVLESIHLKDDLKDIVDWPQSGILGLGKKEPGETDGFVFQDVNTVVNAYHYQALKIMSEIADVLGKPEESKRYSVQAENLKKAFNSILLDKKRGIYVDGIGTGHASLHANMFPLAFGLAPAKNIRAVNAFIRSRGMACSVYGSQFLMDAVYDGNNGDYGLELLTSVSERSWYNMIRAGSTISMEAWDNKYKPNQDWNHAWGAAPANIIPRKLMGIEPLEPGFRKIRIKPQPGELKHAEIKHPTIRGDVLVSFDNDPDRPFRLKVTIPANATADVYLPFRSKSQKVMLNGESVSFVAEGHYAVIKNVGSGSHGLDVYF